MPPRKRKGSKFKFQAEKRIRMDASNNMEIVGEWEEDLMWCPSQCYLQIKHGFYGYQIYLRWRHDDPWTCRLIRKTDPDEQWSEDLFEKYGHFWTDQDDLKKIEECAVGCCRRFLEEGFIAGR